jgi:putative DNA primase/helicase
MNASDIDQDNWHSVVPIPEGLLPRLPSGRKASDIYPYRDESGGLTGFVVRIDKPEGGKEFFPCRLIENALGSRKWEWKGPAEPRPLFGLDQLSKHPDAPVVVCEGEKAAIAAAELLPDYVTVTSPNGANAAEKADWKPLFGRHVTIWHDNDEPGERYAEAVAKILGGRARSLAIVTLPADVSPGWDAADALADGWDWRRAQELLEGAEPVKHAPRSAQPEDDPVAWPEPKPLPAGLPPVPKFPTDLLPEAFRPWAIDIAERMHCPVDYPAIGMMIGAASLIGRKIAIRPKRRDNWTCVPNLWGMAVGRPGTTKTPALQEAIKPLVAMEAEAAECHRRETAAWEAGAEVNKAEKQIRASRIKKTLENEGREAAAKLAGTEALSDRPIRRRYIANDATVEKLGELLNQNPNGLLLFRDEMMGLLRGMDRDGHEQDRAFLLEAWSGDGRYTFDRIGRGTVEIEAACVSLLGGIQPGPLGDYLAGAIRQGAADDGFIQRLQLVVWPDPPTEWRNVDRWPDKLAKAAATAAFKRLDCLDHAIAGAETEEGELPFLRFDADAQALYDESRSDLENRLVAGTMHPAMESHLAKYRSLIPSLALICHLVDGGVGSVTEAAMARAAAWGDFLEAHARRLYHSVIHREADAARRLAEKIQNGDLPAPFTLRDVYRPQWTGLDTRAGAQGAVDLLVDHDWLREETVRTAGRSSTVYHVNPRVAEVAR